MYDERKARIIGGVFHNDVVPTFKVRILLDEVGKGIPLVLGSNKTGVTRADVVEGRVALDEIIGGPLQGSIADRNEGWITKSSRVGLKKVSMVLINNYPG